MNTNQSHLFSQKYQPIYLKDFQLDHEMKSLISVFLKMDQLNVLFIGNEGSGKTCLLNAIIREYYSGVPERLYEKNILSITCLKEQGIEFYRNEVKIFCQTCSSIPQRKKIVILDDMDQINEQGQQVFRNYIDKYSHNVHFLASSLCVQKVLENLQSRFMIIHIPPFTTEKMNYLMNKIQYYENIYMDYDAKDFILKICNQNAKTMIHYMEKFKLLNAPLINLEIAHQLCTNINFQCFEKYITLVKEKQILSSVQIMYELFDKGYTVMDILDCFFFFVKTTEIMTEDEKYSVIPLICKYITIFHNIHEEELELALFTNELIKTLHG